MKLKNKNTGVIGDLVAYDADKGIFAVKARGGDRYYYYSLAALHEVWEDYEETKEYWYLENNGEVVKTTYEGNLYEEKMQEIGNYFSSREEAEKAVEKLEAIQRLKSYYIKFKLDFVKNKIDFTYRIDGTLHSSIDEERIIFEDLAMLFGGEK